MRAAFGVLRKDVGENLDRDMAPEPGVARPIDFTHAARAEERDDLYEPNRCPGAICCGGRQFEGAKAAARNVSASRS